MPVYCKVPPPLIALPLKVMFGLAVVAPSVESALKFKMPPVTTVPPE